MPLQAWLNRAWYGHAAPRWWLVPFASLYAVVISLRRLAYRRGWCSVARLSRPVVIVGNLTVGGTGKTPLVIWLATQLAAQGRRPGIVTRGFGGSAGSARRVGPDDDPAVIGDEALLLVRRAEVPVAVGRDRPAAARILIEAGCDVIVSDDGLQHLALPRACEIVVIDGTRGFGNGALLPAGPLREPAARLRDANAVVVNGGEPQAQAGIPMRLQADRALALSGAARRPLSAFSGASVHAVAGIGNPERFFSMLRAFGMVVDPRPLDDHAPIGRADIEFGDDWPVLMTEKDAVKCLGLGSKHHWVVPVDAVFSPADAAALLEIVMGAIDSRRAGAGED